jgi:YidC/Oxa1 family membrane protein insertase
MDRKSISVIVACIVMLVLWQFVIVPKYWPYHPPPATTNTVNSAHPTLGTNADAGSNSVSAVSTSPLPSAVSSSQPQMEVNTNVAEQLMVVTNENARYTFTSYGGGLKLVELLNYPESVPSWRNKKAQTGLASLNTYTPAPTLAILNGSSIQGDGIFTLTRSASGIRAQKTLTNGLTIVKDFSPTTNFLLNASVWLENNSKEPLKLPEQEWTVGTATPMNPDDRGTFYVGMMWSDGQKTHDTVGSSYFSGHGFACTPRTPPAEYRAGDTNVAWAAVHNQFFALAIVPHDVATAVVMRKVDLPRLEGDAIQMYSSNGYTASLIYPATTLSTNQILQRQFVLYAGPKEYRTLAKVADELNNNLDSVMDFGWFGFFAKGLLLAMNFVHAVLRVPYGWVIVLITVMLRVAFWPLTAAGTRSMKRMQSLQPQIKAIQEKYKDDPMKAQKKQMEFWKENKINPLGGCLPAVIQMPVFIGFYRMIRTAIELRGAHFLWVTDLSKPDTLFLIPGINFPFNLLPLLMVGVMVWQAHLTPPSPGMDPGQQKMMRYMPALFLVFLYNYSSGMALYMFASTLLGIVQTKMTRMQPVTAATPALTSPPKKKK